jgi:hypothetical protein
LRTCNNSEVKHDGQLKVYSWVKCHVEISHRKHTTHNPEAQMNNRTETDKHSISHKIFVSSRLNRAPSKLTAPHHFAFCMMTAMGKNPSIYALHCLNISSSESWKASAPGNSLRKFLFYDVCAHGAFRQLWWVVGNISIIFALILPRVPWINTSNPKKMWSKSNSDWSEFEKDNLVKTNRKGGAVAQLCEKQWMWCHLRLERATMSLQMRSFTRYDVSHCSVDVDVITELCISAAYQISSSGSSFSVIGYAFESEFTKE